MVDLSLIMVILGGALVASLVLLRGLPETRGRDLFGPGPPDPKLASPDRDEAPSAPPMLVPA